MELSKERISSLAIGRFDGFHLGHMKLLQYLDSNGAVLIIHRPAPQYLLPREYIPKYINIPTFLYHLDEIQHLTGFQFIKKLFQDFPNLRKIVVGYDFAFGKDRQSSATDIGRLCNCDVKIVDEVAIDRYSIHSATIAKLLKLGNIKQANRLLGRNYTIFGKHIRGQGLGDKNLVPTLNIEFGNFHIPKHGVYLTKTYLEGESYFSISFIGNRETTDNQFTLESHLFKFPYKNRNFGEVETQFLDFIRENRKFPDLESLKIAIQQDIATAQKLLQ